MDMRRALTFFILCISAMTSAYAQEKSDIEIILAVIGAADVEDADQYEVERLSSLLERPLRLNQATSSRLLSSGLFSQYQAASILDYRRRHGDILSFSELALVDGFNESFTRLIRPFIDLSSGVLATGETGRSNQEMRLRSGSRIGDETTWNYAAKYEFESYSGVSAGLAVSRSASSDSNLPDSFSANFEYESVRVPVKFIAGDYTARFGQGLAMWNGMSMSGLSSPSTFLRRSSAYTRSSSFTGNYALTGVAASISLEDIAINASLALPGVKSLRASPDKVSVLPLMNLTWNRRHGQVGVTHYLDFRNGINDMKTSLDMAWCIRGTDIFAELAYDWKEKVPAGLAGASFPLGESFRGAVMTRVFPMNYASERSGAQRSLTKCSNEYSLTMAAEYQGSGRAHVGSVSVDVACFPESKADNPDGGRQIKVLASWAWTSDRTSVKVRVNERVRNWGQMNRTDLRLDVSFPIGWIDMNIRSNLLYSKAFAALIYAEAAYVGKSCSAYIRSGVFKVDNWDDRIYVYERDAPGSFNVPAMYGRGVWGAATVSWRLTRRLKLYGRASYTSYPFMEKKKPGRAELKLQCVVSF